MADPLPLSPETTSAELEQQLYLILDQICARLHAGERLSVAEYQAAHPQLADRLASLIPMIKAMTALGPELQSEESRFDQIRPLRREADSSISPRHAGVFPLPAPDGKSDRPDVFTPHALGDFQIVRELGRGGMGYVFEAEQLSMGRRVALKVLPFVSMIDEKALRRFQNEVRAAASLDHEHIVPIYAVGEDRGVHFYAMQLIRGHSLAELIAAMSAEAQPEPSPSAASPVTGQSDQRETRAAWSWSTQPVRRGTDWVRSAAQLMIQAAEALQSAHDQGIIHRDIKPANLMIDQKDKLWVTDFGLARTRQQDGLTMTGDVVGTLRYMSPEQSQGRHTAIDHRTDIYALAATFYELLTLEPPFQGHDRQELLRKITHTDPVPLRTLNPAVPDDLQTILLKALEKGPSDRYATASALADDLRRYVNHQPIQARRPNLMAHLTKWSRRNRTLAISCLTTLVVTLAVASTLLWRSQNQTQAALAQADANLRKATAAVDDMYVRLADQWMRDQPRLTKVQAEFLQKAADFYSNIPTAASPSPDERRQMAVIQYRLGRIHRSLGKMPASKAALQLAVQSWESLAKDSLLSVTDTVSHAECLVALGRQEFEFAGSPAEQRREAAHQRLHQALEILQPLVDAASFNEPAQLAYLETCGAIGVLLYKNGEHRTAEPWTRRSVQVAERISKEHPPSPGLLADWASLLCIHARVLHELKETTEEEAIVRRAVSIAEESATQHPEVPRCQEALIDSLTHLAVIVQFSQPAESIALNERAVGLLENLSRLFPDIPLYPMMANGVYQNLVVEYGQSPRQDLAKVAEFSARRVKAVRSVMAISANPSVADRSELISALMDLAHAQEQVSSVGDAQVSLREALREQLALLPDLQQGYEQAPTNPDTRGALFVGLRQAAQLTYGQGDRAAAIEYWQRAAALGDDLPVAERYAHAEAQFTLAWLLAEEGRYLDSLAAYDRCASLNPTLRPVCLAHRGELLARLGRPADARQAYWTLLTVLPVDHPAGLHPQCQFVRAVALYRLGNPRASLETLGRLPQSTASEANLLAALAHWSLGERGEARRLLSQMSPVTSSQFPWIARQLQLQASTLIDSDDTALRDDVTTNSDSPTVVTLDHESANPVWTVRTIRREKVWVPLGQAKRSHNFRADPGSSWREPSFDDTNWPVVPGPRLTEDSDESAPQPTAADKVLPPPTAYYRQEFQASENVMPSRLRATVLYDNAVAMYLNGVELTRQNLAADAGFSDSGLRRGHSPDLAEIPVDPGLLRPGRNVLAAEVHPRFQQVEMARFDLSLVADGIPQETMILHFSELVGEGDNQIPADASVESATLDIDSSDEHWPWQLVHLAQATADRSVPIPRLAPSEPGMATWDVTDSVRTWLGGGPNEGWGILLAASLIESKDVVRPSRVRLRVAFRRGQRH